MEESRGIGKRIVILETVLAVWLLLMTAAGVCADDGVRARVDRNRIGLNESLHLTVEADGALSSFSSLDTTPLERDFRILGQSTSSTFQFGSGKRQATKSWILELEPKHTGKLTIPPFEVRGHRTQPLTITVTDAPAAAASPGKASARNADAFLEVIPEIEVPAYVQSQITISVKLYLRRGLRLSDASLEEPDIDKAAVIKLGDTRRYNARRNNIDYQVIERRYAIIPEEGKELTIPALHFQARAGIGGAPGSFFDNDPFFNAFGGRTRRLRAQSPPLRIPLKAMPQNFHGKIWLPARKLTLKEEGGPQPGTTKLKVGEPLTRIITIEALGLSAEQLPEIDFPNLQGGKFYSDKPELATGVQGHLLHAVRHQSVAFIPEQPGQFTLPEIRIKWWDVVNEREAEAVLPARTIEVTAPQTEAGPTGNSRANQSPPPAASPTAEPGSATPKTGSGQPAKSSSTSGDRQTASNASLKLWQGLTGLFALLWMVTLGFWLKARRQAVPDGTRPVTAPSQVTPNRAAAVKELEKACRANHPKAAHQALLGWGAAAWPETPPLSLTALAERLAEGNDRQREELETLFLELEQALYSPAGGSWEGKRFWQNLKPRLKVGTSRKGRQTDPERLPPLYPKRP